MRGAHQTIKIFIMRELIWTLSCRRWSHVILGLLFTSCIYKAGNRHSNINYRWKSTVSPYYIAKYMKTIDTFHANREIVNSEIVNFPETFVPVTDSTSGLKYVIEFNNMDSLKSLTMNDLDLESIYDFNRKEWITSQDSLKGNELARFKEFFEDSVMARTVQAFRGKVADTLLFVGGAKAVKLMRL